jgi:hypothetical protein
MCVYSSQRQIYSFQLEARDKSKRKGKLEERARLKGV